VAINKKKEMFTKSKQEGWCNFEILGFEKNIKVKVR
jgi:hypothetical protein